MTIHTNIKNLPENAKYMTMHGYSDAYPYVVIKETATTKVLSPVLVERDPEWKPEMHPGGFAAHCSNQSEQTWLYSLANKESQIRVYKTKKGWSRKGFEFTEDRAIYFHDYNF